MYQSSVLFEIHQIHRFTATETLKFHCVTASMNVCLTVLYWNKLDRFSFAIIRAGNVLFYTWHFIIRTRLKKGINNG